MSDSAEEKTTTLEPDADLDEARRKLALLARDIQALKDQAPELTFLANLAMREIAALEVQLETLTITLRRLVTKCDYWVCDLQGRYTFLRNMELWLAIHTDENGQALVGASLDGHDDLVEPDP